MFVKRLKKWRKNDDETAMLPYYYYHVCESYRDSKTGKSRQRVVMGLGDLAGMTSEEDLKELARLLTFLIEKGEYLISDNEALSDKAVELYNRYRREKADEEQRLGVIQTVWRMPSIPHPN